MLDEYNFKSILSQFNIDDDHVLKTIIAHFDDVAGQYMKEHDKIAHSVSVKVSCWLKMALIDNEDKDFDLKKRINEIIDYMKPKDKDQNTCAKEYVEDEYKLQSILLQLKINDNKLEKALTSQFDKLCGDYMTNKEEIEQGPFSEISFFLHKALLDDMRKGIKLEKGIEELIQSIDLHNEEKTENT